MLSILSPAARLAVAGLLASAAIFSRALAADAPQGSPPSNLVRVTLLQLNDVYEIAPLNQGRIGGLARVATLRKELLAQNPNTFTIHAGDFLSPSPMGNAQVAGARLAGRQMVHVLRTMGLDYITFGNHEFDLKEADFMARMGDFEKTPGIADRFPVERSHWVSSNVTDQTGQPFPGVEPVRVLEVKSAHPGGHAARIGIFGLTIRMGSEKYYRISDPITAAKTAVAKLKAQNVDAIVAITHLDLEEDQRLAREVPGIDLILGGHEHVNNHSRQAPVNGETHLPAPIFKADANARTVYIHDLWVDAANDRVARIDSQLKPVTDAIPEEPWTAAVAKWWTARAAEAFAEQGYSTERVIYHTTEVLDGMEESVRSKSTNLTELVGDAMVKRLPVSPGIALYNSGSLRLDDILSPGGVKEYDVLRILPFPGDVMGVQITGAELKQILESSLDPKHVGNGSFLQKKNIQRAENSWMVNGTTLRPEATYQLAINSYLLGGNEKDYGHLQDLFAALEKRAQPLGDWRKIVIEHMKSLNTNPAPQP